ncbi:ANTAR domain-containing protein [Auraticoccus monumenti]|uniref:ANTAR domain-containing protein n=1 Tax=Auraticoccus monumenti TaxID=675864 RepID=A0A1G7BVY1_9ACTN|nr:ANTAR domain-containing protein [Auraticoccus monumenti]SDE31197.1 ANTAR domain-containing protein [Auraticoccus monumenti]
MTEHPLQLSGRQVLAMVARAVAEDSPEPLALRLCRLTTVTAGADGGALSLATGTTEHHPLGATDETADRLDDLQEVLRAGPGPRAFLTGVSSTLSTRHPPAEWAEAASVITDTVGPCYIDAVPMRSRGRSTGAFTCYRREPRAPATAPESLQLLVDAVGAVLVSPESLQTLAASDTWAQRSRLHQATGMVLAQLGLSADDAYALLRAHSFAADQTMDDTATQVLERALDFTRIDPDPEGDAR